MRFSTYLPSPCCDFVYLLETLYLLIQLREFIYVVLLLCLEMLFSCSHQQSLVYTVFLFHDLQWSLRIERRGCDIDVTFRNEYSSGLFMIVAHLCAFVLITMSCREPAGGKEVEVICPLRLERCGYLNRVPEQEVKKWKQLPTEVRKVGFFQLSPEWKQNVLPAQIAQSATREQWTTCKDRVSRLRAS